MEYTVIIEKNAQTGMYVGQCKQIPEAISQGSTLDDLLKNMKEAIELAIGCHEEELRAEFPIPVKTECSRRLVVREHQTSVIRSSSEFPTN